MSRAISRTASALASLVVGFFIIHVTSALIHLLIVLAVVAVLGNFLRGVGSRRTA